MKQTILKLFVIILISQTTWSCDSGYSQQDKAEDDINIKFDRNLRKLASEINKYCPYMLDTATRLDSASGDTLNNFTYNFTLVKQELAELDLPKLTANFRTNIVGYIKHHPDMAGFIENKVTLFYRYQDKKGNFVTEVKIGPEDYLTAD